MKAQKQTELSVVALLPVDRAELALNSKKTEKELRDLVARVAGITAPTNAEGRQECHAGYMSLRNARVAIESTGKKAREDATAFSKAVIAEEKKLVAIVDPEETRLKALRDEWDAAREAERQALIEAERLRVDALRGRIAAIASYPSQFALKPSSEVRSFLQTVKDSLESGALETFDELSDEAEAVFASTIETLEAMYEDKLNAEAAEQAAREAAEAEAARVAAEAERVAAESARLAAERKAFEDRQSAAAEASKNEADRIEAERRQLEAEREAFARLQAELETPAPCLNPNFSDDVAEFTDAADFVEGLLEEMAETPVVYVPPVVDGISLQDAANVMCGQLPPGYIVHLAMENGAAWVMLFNDEGEEMVLPDAADKSIARQLGDALVVALGE